MHSSSAAARLFVATCLTAASTGAAARVSAADFLPAASLYLEAARYAPVEADLHWTGTMGGGADVFEAAGVRGYIVGDVETVIGNTRRGFDATQANYHLETGARRRWGRVVLNPFFHHVSRHLVDREKAPAVDWNILGVRASSRLGRDGRAHVAVGIGHTTLASLVGYRWELTARGDLRLAGGERFSPYVGGRARFVTVDPDPALVREDFLDFRLEGGLRFSRELRLLEVFAAFERRNDVFLLRPGRRDRGLFGVRIGLSAGE